MENASNETKLVRSDKQMNKEKTYENNSNKGRLVITNNTVYEYDMDCLSKNKRCF